MPGLHETEISRSIVSTYHEKLSDRIVSDVLICGAGPSGLTAAFDLARKGVRVTVLEKRLSPGGGIWGGGMAMSEAVFQDDALPLLDEVGVRHRPCGGGLHTADSVELAAGLCWKALQAGAVLLNLLTAEDVCVRDGRVTGAVVNRSMIGEALPIDPITFAAGAVVDATGHDAAVFEALRKRGIVKAKGSGEGPMDAAAGEAFVVENVCQIYPGLWVCGMSVCTALGGPRMGPIFGGMLLSGRRAAELIADELTKSGD